MPGLRRLSSPRWELWLVRADNPTERIGRRSRHRFRALAELSRRLDADHSLLLPACALLVVDRTAADGPSAAVLPMTTASPALR